MTIAQHDFNVPKDDANAVETSFRLLGSANKNKDAIQNSYTKSGSTDLIRFLTIIVLSTFTLFSLLLYIIYTGYIILTPALLSVLLILIYYVKTSAPVE